MALKITKSAAAIAVAAAFSLLATPVAAVELPKPAAVKAYDGEALDAGQYRRRRYRDRDNIDAGDVVAGVVLLGAIAAIAGAARNARNRDRYEERYPLPDDDAGYRTQGDYQGNDGRGIDRAVDICVGEVERGEVGRVGSVDAATRTGDGWHVSGQLEGGAAYSCTIGNDGRVSDVDLGSSGYGTYPAERVEDGQWDDDDYSAARENEGYPGDDGRYETAEAPEFE